VGRILHYVEDHGGNDRQYFSFCNYFRCRQCDSGGPWEIGDQIKILKLRLRATLSKNFTEFMPGRLTAFDGTFVQTPAMGEDHLLKLIKTSPEDAFLRTRLGNLFRGCDQQGRAAESYAKALALDPGDLEARIHLLSFAVQANDLRTAQGHAPLLVRFLLDGRRLGDDELTEAIALELVSILRSAPEPLRELFLSPSSQLSQGEEYVFIRTLLTEEGDEQAVQRKAAQRLLGNEARLTASWAPVLDLIASLREVVQANGLDVAKLAVGIEADKTRRVILPDRHTIFVSDSHKAATWAAPSLGELFRGNRPPPPDMEHYPPEYMPCFVFIEDQFLTLCEAIGDRTDQEMEEVYSALRRRPDGRRLNLTHDFLWQVSALLLGLYPLSAAEYESLIGALVRSTRKWALRPISRNYVTYLRRILVEGPDREDLF